MMQTREEIKWTLYEVKILYISSHNKFDLRLVSLFFVIPEVETLEVLILKMYYDFILIF